MTIVMGGKHKKSIKQMEKGQTKKAEEKPKEKPSREAAEQTREKLGVIGADLLRKIEAEIQRQSYLTPTVLSERYNLQIGASKRVLRTLAAKNSIRLVSKTRRTPLYAPMTQSSAAVQVSP